MKNFFIACLISLAWASVLFSQGMTGVVPSYATTLTAVTTPMPTPTPAVNYTAQVLPGRMISAVVGESRVIQFSYFSPNSSAEFRDIGFSTVGLRYQGYGLLAQGERAGIYTVGCNMVVGVCVVQARQVGAVVLELYERGNPLAPAIPGSRIVINFMPPASCCFQDLLLVWISKRQVRPGEMVSVWITAQRDFGGRGHSMVVKITNPVSGVLNYYFDTGIHRGDQRLVAEFRLPPTARYGPSNVEVQLRDGLTDAVVSTSYATYGVGRSPDWPDVRVDTKGGTISVQAELPQASYSVTLVGEDGFVHTLNTRTDWVPGGVQIVAPAGQQTQGSEYRLLPGCYPVVVSGIFGGLVYQKAYPDALCVSSEIALH